MDQSFLQKNLSPLFASIDEDILTYISGVIFEEITHLKNDTDVYELLNEQLITHELSEEGEETQNLCKKIFETIQPIIQSLTQKEKKLEEKIKMDEEIRRKQLEDKKKEEDETKALSSSSTPSSSSSLSSTKKEKKTAKKKGKKGETKKVAKKTVSTASSSTTTSQMEDDEFQVASIAGSRGRVAGGTSKNIHIFDVTIAINGRDLLSAGEIKLTYGEKYGLVGRNGIGKTTLMRWIAEKRIKGFPTYLSTLIVKQEVPSSNQTALECVISADTERESLLKEEKELVEKKGDIGKDAEEIGKRLEEIYSRMEQIGAETVTERAKTILNGLQFTTKQQNMKTKELSGGWRMRVALAQALFMKPDILLMDEPTNHLDLEAVLWLQEYLDDYPGTVLVVSHDESFLDAFTTYTIHYNNSILKYYPGNFSAFKKTRLERMQKLFNLQETIDKKRQHMQESVKKMEKAAKGKNKKKGGDQKKLGQVASRKKKLERFGAEKDENGQRWKWSLMGYRPGSLAEAGGGTRHQKAPRLLIEPNDPEVKFNFPPTDNLGVTGSILQLKHISFHYGSNSDIPDLFSDVSLDINPKTRLALVGKNGLGKSTLLNLILGTLQPTQGEIYRHHNLRLAIFAQHHVEALDLKLTPLEHMIQTFPGVKEMELRGCLGHFGLGGSLALQTMSKLSGGEKSRVIFATVTFQKPHILILDEPTNHLDFDTISGLIEAIQEFEGGIIIVSHNQSLVRQTCKECWEIKNRKVVRVEGGFAEYVSGQLKNVDRD